MRPLFLLFVLLLQLPTALAQRLEIESKLKLSEPTASTAYSIDFSIKNSRPGDIYTVRIEDRNRGKATPGRDYVLSPNPTTVTLDNSTSMRGSFTLTVNSDTENDEPDETIVLRLQAQKASNPDTMLIKYVTFTITGTGKTTPAKHWIMPVADTTYNNLKIVTAASFDFFGKSQFKNFAGDLTLNMPELWLLGNTVTIGLNTSIFHYNYYTADSTRGTPYAENIILDPAVRSPVIDSTRFVRNTFNLESKTSIKTWGYNAQVLFGLQDYDKKRIIRSYYTLHFEGLNTQTSTTFKKYPIRADTLVYTTEDANASAPFTVTPRATNTQVVNEVMRAYLGLGYTTYLAVPKKFDLYGQAIFGMSTNTPVTRITYTELRNGARLSRSRTTFENVGFYLLKTRITEKVTKLNGTAGVEVRGNFGETKPFVAAYLGIQISLDTFFKK